VRGDHGRAHVRCPSSSWIVGGRSRPRGGSSRTSAGRVAPGALRQPAASTPRARRAGARSRAGVTARPPEPDRRTSASPGTLHSHGHARPAFRYFASERIPATRPSPPLPATSRRAAHAPRTRWARSGIHHALRQHRLAIPSPLRRARRSSSRSKSRSFTRSARIRAAAAPRRGAVTPSAAGTPVLWPSTAAVSAGVTTFGTRCGRVARVNAPASRARHRQHVRIEEQQRASAWFCVMRGRAARWRGAQRNASISAGRVEPARSARVPTATRRATAPPHEAPHRRSRTGGHRERMRQHRARSPLRHLRIPVRRLGIPCVRLRIPRRRTGLPVRRLRIPVRHLRIPVRRTGLPLRRLSLPVRRTGSSPASSESSRATHGSSPASSESSRASPESSRATHGSSRASPESSRATHGSSRASPESPVRRLGIPMRRTNLFRTPRTRRAPTPSPSNAHFPSSFQQLTTHPPLRTPHPPLSLPPAILLPDPPNPRLFSDPERTFCRLLAQLAYGNPSCPSCETVTPPASKSATPIAPSISAPASISSTTRRAARC